MAVLDNTIKQEDLVAAQDIQFVANFNGDINPLLDILGIFGPEVVAAGTTMFQYKVTGSLSAESVEEGDEVPLSKYNLTKESVGSFEVKPYRKLVTAQAVLKSGYDNAVIRTDAQMVKDIRAGIMTAFFTFLKNGTGEATGDGLQATIAQANAKLTDTLEKNNDSATSLVWFINPFDIADYLAKAEVTIQTVYGMNYLESFLGVSNIFVTNKVDKGTIYVTPTDNIHLYGTDFGALAQGGLSYETQESNLIGVHHQPAYNRTSCETYALVGATLLAEVKDYIVKGTITPLE